MSHGLFAPVGARSHSETWSGWFNVTSPLTHQKYLIADFSNANGNVSQASLALDTNGHFTWFQSMRRSVRLSWRAWPGQRYTKRSR